MFEFTKQSIKEIDEKIILISVIGVLETLESNCINIDEAEKFLFSPHMIKLFCDKGCNKKILNILEKGCELEDVNSLFPEKLSQTIVELKQESIGLLSSYKQYNKEFWLD